ncbi:DNA-processing protein DprA [Nocardioides montaniterrae]
MSGVDDDRVARAALSVIAEPGDLFFTEAVVREGAPTVLEWIRTRVGEEAKIASAQARAHGVDGTRELERAEERGVRFVIPGDPEWPPGLADLRGVSILDARGGVPIGLWVAGPLTLDTLDASVAVVGARNSTTYGDQVAIDISAGLAARGFTIISGAAIGIDYAAHRGAVAGDGPTVAVLACGVDRDYPPRHSRLLAHLRTHGAVISEAPLGSAPQRIRFLARNRLIAALSRGTVVVEAAARSGALNTLNWAQKMGREAMGVPGPVTSGQSVGVHHQLRSGGTNLVTSAEDVLELVSRMGENMTVAPRGPEGPRDQRSLVERQVLDAVPAHRAAPATSIARVAALEVLEVEGMLTTLEQEGLIERDTAGWRLAAEADR